MTPKFWFRLAHSSAKLDWESEPLNSEHSSGGVAHGASCRLHQIVVGGYNMAQQTQDHPLFSCCFCAHFALTPFLTLQSYLEGRKGWSFQGLWKLLNLGCHQPFWTSTTRAFDQPWPWPSAASDPPQASQTTEGQSICRDLPSWQARVFWFLWLPLILRWLLMIIWWWLVLWRCCLLVDDCSSLIVCYELLVVESFGCKSGTFYSCFFLRKLLLCYRENGSMMFYRAFFFY